MTTEPSKPDLAAEREDLRARLAEAEEALRAIKDGEVDAVVVAGGHGEQVYTLRGADRVYRQLIETMSEGAATLSADGVILYGNVPVRRPGLLDTAVSILATTGCDSVQSFAPVGKHHPWWMYTMDADGRVAFYDDHKVYRRQELPALYVPDAAAIVVRRDVLLASEPLRAEPHAFFGTDRRGIVQPPEATVDIDTELDLLVAEAMLRRAGGGK